MRVALVAFVLFCTGCGSQTQEDAKSKDADDGKLVVSPRPEEPGRPVTDDAKKAPDQQTITFLNSQGTGRRFCIIADHSNSLSAASFGLIKREMMKTLRSMDERTQFHVMFFSDKPRPMPGDDWRRGKDDVDAVAAWVDTMSQHVGTVAAPAFDAALKLKPRPDVIFFMTDGKLRPTDPERVAALNSAEPKVVIHTILFTKTVAIVPAGAVARDNLEKIATDAGGTFTQFVDPDVLPKKKKKAV